MPRWLLVARGLALVVVVEQGAEDWELEETAAEEIVSEDQVRRVRDQDMAAEVVQAQALADRAFKIQDWLPAAAMGLEMAPGMAEQGRYCAARTKAASRVPAEAEDRSVIQQVIRMEPRAVGIPKVTDKRRA